MDCPSVHNHVRNPCSMNSIEDGSNNLSVLYHGSNNLKKIYEHWHGITITPSTDINLCPNLNFKKLHFCPHWFCTWVPSAFWNPNKPLYKKLAIFRENSQISIYMDILRPVTFHNYTATSKSFLFASKLYSVPLLKMRFIIHALRNFNHLLINSYNSIRGYG